MSSRVGTIYVELDMDTSRFMKSQQQLYIDSKKAADNVEQNFKNLGIKSDATFDMMRKKAENAFEAIKNSAVSSTADIARAQRALADQYKAIQEEMAGAHELSMAAMTRAVLRLYAAYYIISEVIGTVGGALLNARIEAEAMDKGMTAAMGSVDLAKRAIQFLREESERLGLVFMDQVKSYKSLAAAAKGTALEGAETERIFTAIVTASTALGLSAEQTTGALNAVQQMMSKGNIQAEELRGQLSERIPGAFNMAAKAMGVSTEKLNDMLKAGEVLSSDMLPKLADLMIGRYGDAATQMANGTQASLNKMSTAWDDLKKAIVEDAGPAITGSINIMTSTLKGFVAVLKEAKSGWDYAVTMSDVNMIGTTANPINKAYSARMTRESASIDNTQAKMDAAAASAAYSKHVDRETKSIQEYAESTEKATKAIKESGDTRKQYETSLGSVTDQYNKLTMAEADYQKLKIWQEWEKQEAKLTDVALAARDLALANVDLVFQQKAMKEETEALNKEYKEMEESEKARIKNLKDAEKLAADQAQALRSMYKDMGESAEGYFDAERELLQETYDKHKLILGERLALEQWYASEKKKIDDAEALRGSDFFKGMKIGFEDMQKDAMTFAKGGEKVIKDFASNSATALSDTFFKVIKGEMDSLGEVWTSLWDSMLKTMLDIIAQMLVNEGLKQLMNLFNSSGNLPQQLSGPSDDTSWWDEALSGAATVGKFIYDLFAEGGQYDPNRPFIVGEQGMEIVDPRSRTVYNNADTMNILASTGAAIPAYASGTGRASWAGGIIDYAATVETMEEFNQSAGEVIDELWDVEHSLNGLDASVSRSQQSIQQQTAAVQESTQASYGLKDVFGVVKDAATLYGLATGVATLGLSAMSGNLFGVAMGLAKIGGTIVDAYDIITKDITEFDNFAESLGDANFGGMLGRGSTSLGDDPTGMYGLFAGVDIGGDSNSGDNGMGDSQGGDSHGGTTGGYGSGADGADQWATGGYYDPTKMFWAGEAGPELIDPRINRVYNNKDSMQMATGNPNVTVNVTNNAAGTQITAKATRVSQTDQGLLVDLIVDAAERNVGRIRSVFGIRT